MLGFICPFALLFPHSIEFIRLDVQPFNWTLGSVTIILNLITIYRYYRSYLYSRFPLQIAIVYSSGWLIVSQMIMLAGEVWRLSWWLYHFLLLASMIGMLVGLVKQYAANQSLTGAIRVFYDGPGRKDYKFDFSERESVNDCDGKQRYLYSGP